MNDKASLKIKTRMSIAAASGHSEEEVQHTLKALSTSNLTWDG
jgi:hypothetical protein